MGRETINQENVQFQGKNDRLSFYFFVTMIMIISILVIGYICSNIILMNLGYHSINLENQIEEMLVKKGQLEYTVECLSSLTRIERIASQELGMHRPERIEFVAMLPEHVIVLESSEKDQKTIFIEAGSFIGEFAHLKVFEK